MTSEHSASEHYGSTTSAQLSVVLVGLYTFSDVRHADILHSGAHRRTARLAQMHHENATHEAGLLLSHSAFLLGVSMRPPLLAEVRSPTYDTRLPIFEEPDSISTL
jgi:hypothetical protein